MLINLRVKGIPPVGAADWVKLQRSPIGMDKSRNLEATLYGKEGSDAYCLKVYEDGTVDIQMTAKRLFQVLTEWEANS